MKNIHISDHALMRYFERYVGLDIEEFKQKLSNHLRGKVKKKNCMVETDYGVAVIKNWTVATFYTKEQYERYKFKHNIK